MQMRKIIKKENKSFFSDKRKIGLVIIGLFLIFLMVGSMLISREENTNEYEYNGFYFVQLESGMWKLQYGDNSLVFEYDPKSLENISVDDFNLSKEKIYLGFYPNETGLQSGSLQRIQYLLSLVSQSVIPACFIEENCPDIPIVSCNGKEQIVGLKYGEENKIYEDKSCLILQYTEEETKIINLFTYKLLGVI